MGTVTTFKTVRFVTSLEGHPIRSGVDQTFTNIRTGAGTSISSSFGEVLLGASTTTNQYQSLIRGITLFNTSTIEANAVIDSATLYISATSTTTGLGTNTLELVSSNPASTSSLVAADFSTLGSTSFSSTSIGSIIVGTNAMNLNSSGLANITIGGVSKFGFVLGWDLNNSFTGTWVSVATTSVVWSGGQSVLTVSYHFNTPTLDITGPSSLVNIPSIITS